MQIKVLLFSILYDRGTKPGKEFRNRIQVAGSGYKSAVTNDVTRCLPNFVLWSKL